MRYLQVITAAIIAISQQNLALAQDKSYQDRCIQAQINLHEQHKKIAPNDFRAFCECTEKQLRGTLSPSQFNEMLGKGQKPSWLKSAQDTAAKACLKPEPKIEA
jgi:hypothetical protein